MINPFVVLSILFAVFSISVVIFVSIVERGLRKELAEICEYSVEWIENLENEIIQLKKRLNEK